MAPSFEWDSRKDASNHSKHGVSFADAQQAFYDPARVVARDSKHSTAEEERYFCFGVVDGRVLTVRFTERMGKIRIFGAGYWREGRMRYEEEHRLQQCPDRSGSSDSRGGNRH